MATPKKRIKRGWQRDRSGCVVVQFVAPDGKRRTLRLGNIPDKNAGKFVMELRELIDVVALGHASDPQQMKRVTEWVGTLGPKVAEKLVEWGLVRAATPAEAAKLGPFVDHYIGLRNDVKSGTRTFYEQTKRNLVSFFGADRELSTITKLDARAFKAYLLQPKPKNTGDERGEGLAPNSMRRRVTTASQFFRAAVEAEIIQKNPFRGIGETVRSVEERLYFITTEEAAAVLDECPDLEWRLVFGLARFGGLRVPSELDGLKWEHIDWNRQQMLIHSPKTEHHQGGESRWTPFYRDDHPHLFGHLPALLRDAFERAEPGSEYVLGRLRGHTNLGTTMKKIIQRAGITPWEKTFQNCRSTRVTELLEKYVVQDVAKWMGHSPATLYKFYAQLQAASFKASKRQPTGGAAMALQSGSSAEGQEGSGEIIEPSRNRSHRGESAKMGVSASRPNDPGRTTRNASIAEESQGFSESTAIALQPGGSSGDSGSDHRADVVELHALIERLPAGAVREVLEVARALAADASRDATI